MSERRVCQLVGQARATQRRQATEQEEEVGLTADISGYATQYGRYGYRRITALLRRDGWIVKTTEAAEGRRVVVNGWILCSSPAVLAEPCLVLWLRVVRTHDGKPAPGAAQAISIDPGSKKLRQDLWLDSNPILTYKLA